MKYQIRFFTGCIGSDSETLVDEFYSDTLPIIPRVNDMLDLGNFLYEYRVREVCITYPKKYEDNYCIEVWVERIQN